MPGLGTGMPDTRKIQQYLALAEQADSQASTSVGKHVRESWLRIAISYREMAQSSVSGALPDAVSEPVSIAAPERARCPATPAQGIWRRIWSGHLFSAIFSWAPTSFGSR
jgi:hypothetical protein